MFVFRKIWRALFSCYLSFEVCSFTLQPMIYVRSNYFAKNAASRNLLLLGNQSNLSGNIDL